MTKNSRRYYSEKEMEEWPHYHIAMLGISPDIFQKAVFAEKNIKNLYVFFSESIEGRRTAVEMAEVMSRHFCSRKGDFWTGESGSWNCDNRIFFTPVKYDDYNDIKDKLLDLVGSFPDEVRISIDVTCGRKVMTAAGLVCAYTVGAEVKYLLEDVTDKEKMRTMDERYITIDNPRKPNLDNISDMHLRILKVIEDRNGPSKTQIASDIGTSSQAISNHIKTMLSNNLIIVRNTNGRSQSVFLAPQGTIILRRAKSRGLLELDPVKERENLGGYYLHILEKYAELGDRGCTKKDMCDLLKVAFSALSTPYKGLEERGFIEKFHPGKNQTCYRITQEGLGWLNRRTDSRGPSGVDSRKTADNDSI